jgi:hypothetical protein
MNRTIDTARVREQSRRTCYAAIVAAVRDRNETALHRSVSGLNLFASSATDYGWRLQDVREVFDRIDERLRYEREELECSRQEFTCPTDRRSRRTALVLSRLQDNIANHSENVRILSRTHTLFADALRRRGDIVACMETERTSAVAVMAR